MTTLNTHFEQVPVETVKRIAQELPTNDDIENDVTAETRVEVNPRPKRWREMAQKVQVENDPRKMMKLVEDLITAFDEEECIRFGKTTRTGPVA